MITMMREMDPRQQRKAELAALRRMGYARREARLLVSRGRAAAIIEQKRKDREAAFAAAERQRQIDERRRDDERWGEIFGEAGVLLAMVLKGVHGQKNRVGQ